MTRIQTLLPRVAAIRVDVAITLAWPCGPLATTWSIEAAAIGLRAADAGRMLRGRGAVAPTILPRSTGGEGAGAYARAWNAAASLSVDSASCEATASRAVVVA